MLKGRQCITRDEVSIQRESDASEEGGRGLHYNLFVSLHAFLLSAYFIKQHHMMAVQCVHAL